MLFSKKKKEKKVHLNWFRNHFNNTKMKPASQTQNLGVNLYIHVLIIKKMTKIRSMIFLTPGTNCRLMAISHLHLKSQMKSVCWYI
jgi:hypothetical protein